MGRNVLMAVAVILAVSLASGCGMECDILLLDQQVAECLSKYGDPKDVYSVSEGKELFVAKSRGEIMRGKSGAWIFLDDKSGRVVVVNGNIITRVPAIASQESP